MFAIALRYWWAAVLTVAVGGGAAYVISSSQTPIYEATTSVLIRSGTSIGASSLGDIQASRELGKTYVELIRTTSVLEEVVVRLDLPISARELRERLDVRPVTGTQIMAVSVRDPSAQLAADMAQAVAEVFIAQTQDVQLTAIARVQSALAQYGIAGLQDLPSAQVAALDSLSIAEPAALPRGPVSPRPKRDAALGAMIGLALGMGLMLLLDRVDTRIRSETELAEITALPCIGVVPRFEWDQNEDTAELLVDPTSELHPDAREAYRFLATSLSYVALEHPDVSQYLVTSASPQEGKSTTAANLAAAFAAMGKSVLLVDLDLRRPSLNRFFEVSRDPGVTNVLLNTVEVQQAIVDTSIPGLRLLPSGPPPPDPAPLYRAEAMVSMTQKLSDLADIVIYDSPPMLAVADASILLLHVPAAILVADHSAGNRHLVARVAEDMRRFNPEPSVAILNRVARRRGWLPGSGYGYRYGYRYGYDYEGYSGDGRHRSSRLRGSVSRLLRRARTPFRSARRKPD